MAKKISGYIKLQNTWRKSQSVSACWTGSRSKRRKYYGVLLNSLTPKHPTKTG